MTESKSSKSSGEKSYLGTGSCLWVWRKFYVNIWHIMEPWRRCRFAGRRKLLPFTFDSCRSRKAVYFCGAISTRSFVTLFLLTISMLSLAALFPRHVSCVFLSKPHQCFD